MNGFFDLPSRESLLREGIPPEIHESARRRAQELRTEALDAALRRVAHAVATAIGALCDLATTRAERHR